MNGHVFLPYDEQALGRKCELCGFWFGSEWPAIITPVPKCKPARLKAYEGKPIDLVFIDGRLDRVEVVK